jgi:hypothetical protein
VELEHEKEAAELDNSAAEVAKNDEITKPKDDGKLILAEEVALGNVGKDACKKMLRQPLFLIFSHFVVC